MMKLEFISSLISFFIVVYLHSVKPHPTDLNDLKNHVKADEFSLRSVPIPYPKSSTEQPLGTVNPIPPVNYQVSPDSGIMEHGQGKILPFSRQRRSSGKGELQTLFSGNWGGQNPESFLRLLNLLTTKEKEAVFSEDEYDDDELDPEPIDLVYYGKKPYPLVVESTPKSKTINVPLQEPISLMSSGKTREFNMDDDPIKLHAHRLKKYGYPNAPFAKRAYFRKNMPFGQDLDFYYPLPYQNEKKDFTMLPNGEISLTPQGLISLRHILYTPQQIEEGVPVIRRPIL